MDKVGTHAAANAKAKAMLGRLLNERDYKILLKLETVKEVLDYLKKNTHYKGILTDTDEDTQVIEVLMKRYFFSAYEKFYHFYVDDYRAFIKVLFMRFEVENLKLYLRALTRLEKLNTIEAHLLTSKVFSNLDYSKLNLATTLEELLMSLAHTPYDQVLEAYLDEEPSSRIFHMEMVLDRIYFNALSESILKLSQRDQSLMQELLGINIDILNVQWIFRGRYYFNITSEELFNYTLNGGAKYDFRSLKRFCYMDIEDFKREVSQGDYKNIFEDKAYMLERAMERQLYYKLVDFTKQADLSLSLPVVVLFKFEYEIRDLFTILEGIKYQAIDVESLLIRDLRRGN